MKTNYDSRLRKLEGIETRGSVDIVDRIVPHVEYLYMFSQGHFLASIAISLKRIADHLETPMRTTWKPDA